ncbi:curli production assembly protein CsgF [Shewanella baltica]|uniref:curli assembly protein CsgF n=1 Tax=Shewanella baltica TaxID=62322 RepID=UPI0007B46224|nr:curli assembly protein CsgF [Shewanella baltica]KZK68358.1 curli production assembly protein CsgF [Shewanella baltica]
MTYRTLLTLVTLCVASSGQATELIYTPVNPSFGGNPQNGAFLLNKAQAQNDNKSNSSEKDFITRFKESLERNLINSITRGIADGEITDGDYNTGDFRIEINSIGDKVILTITNIATNEVTIIEMSAFGGGN